MRIAFAVALQLGVGAYYAWFAMTVAIGYRWCVEDPVARDGTVLAFPLWTVTAVTDTSHYEISKVVKDVPVSGSAADLEVGDTVSVLGRFRAADLQVVEEDVEVHTLRRAKEALGVLGFVFVVIAAPFAFRWRDGRLEERG